MSSDCISLELCDSHTDLKNLYSSENAKIQSYSMPLFINPCLETFLVIPATLFRDKISASSPIRKKTGILEISHQFLYFKDDVRTFTVTFPFIDIKKIVKSDDERVLKIFLKRESNRSFFLSIDIPDTASYIYQLFKIQNSDSSKSFESGLNNPMHKQKQIIFKSLTKSKNVNQEWERYFEYYGKGITMIHSHTLIELIPKGIPHAERGEFSFFFYKKNFSNK